MNYQPVIGMEVHAELKTKSKMFCGCANESDKKKPNTNICPICTGQPGTLPVINKKAVKEIIKTGLALNCQIFKKSHFNRKNYFYPDLPKGYQISQFEEPICRGGYLEIPVINKTINIEKSQTNSKFPVRQNLGLQALAGEQITKFKKIRIREIHLEEEAGKLIHQKENNCSLVDYNRAGVPLMELVTEPDISSSEEAKKFCQELQLIFRYLSISYADMEKGQMRCEVNISILPKNENRFSAFEQKKTLNELGTKVEIKNLNSFRAVERGIEYEIKRQIKVIESGEKVIQETRGWDDAKGITVSQRLKEEAHDYRYLPEPDLPPFEYNIIDIKKIKAEIPELPRAKRERFAEQFKIPLSDVEIIVSNKYLADYFERVVSELEAWIKVKKHISRNDLGKLIKLTVNYLITELQKLFYQTKSDIRRCKITPENFAEFTTLIFEKKISSSAAQIVLAEMFKCGADPSHIVKEKDLSQLSDEKLLDGIVKKIIGENPQAVQDFKNGKEKSLQFLVGKVMASTKGRANPQVVSNILRERIL